MLNIKKWSDQAHFLSNLKLPRQICFRGGWKNAKIYIFVDGSEIASAACAYVVSYNENINDYDSNFIAAKGRLVPIKNIDKPSIPKIEMAGARLGVVLCRKLVRDLNLNPSQFFFFTD